MKRLYLFLLTLLFVVVSCNQIEDPEPPISPRPGTEIIVGGEYNSLSQTYEFFGPDGGQLAVTSGSDLLFHCVRTYVSGCGYTVLLELEGLFIDSRPDHYPAQFETDVCTVILQEAHTITIDLYPSTERRTVLITTSGIKEDGKFLLPRDIVLYQNFCFFFFDSLNKRIKYGCI